MTLPILKTITAASGVPLNYHVVQSADINFTAGKAVVRVNAWAHQEAYDRGAPLGHVEFVSIDLMDVVRAEATLITQANGLFEGGTVVPDSKDSLEAVRTRQWASLKATRDFFINAPLETPYGVLDGDRAAREAVAQALALMGEQIRLDATVNPSLEFTRADNSVVSLNRAQLSEIALLMGQRVQEVRAVATGLRQQLEQAGSIEAVQGIVWPMDLDS